MKVTQKDIAERLNLSVATVSRALRNDQAFNSGIVAEVMAVAAELGYHPKGKKNFLEQNGETNTKHKYIGVIVKVPIDQDAWAPDEIAHGYLSGMSEISTELNISLIVHHVSDKNVHELTNPKHQPPMIRDKAISGLIFIHHFPHNIVEYFAKSLACVSIVHDVPSANIDHIEMDHQNGIQSLMDMLYDAGHRKIGFIGVRPHLTWSQSRLAAYIQSIIRLELRFDPKLILPEIDLKAVQKKIKEGVTAWVCSIDSIGYKLCRNLLDSGINVPKTVSIVGFNGVSPLLNCPQLTTIKAPLKTMGTFALRRVANRIYDPLHQPIKILHRCELIEGETIGAVKKNRSA